MRVREPIGGIAFLATLSGAVAVSLWSWWPPLAYVAVDRHPLLWLAASGLVVVEINQASAGALRRRIRAVPGPLTPRELLLADLAVVVVAVTLVTICSAAAFSSVVVGDEPKYLRFCESWWQGLGVEITNVRDVSLSAADMSHFTRTLTMIGPALRADLVSLGADVAAGHWAPGAAADRRERRTRSRASAWLAPASRAGRYTLRTARRIRPASGRSPRQMPPEHQAADRTGRSRRATPAGRRLPRRGRRSRRRGPRGPTGCARLPPRHADAPPARLRERGAARRKRRPR